MRLLSTGVEMQSNTHCRGDCAAHRDEAVGQLSALPAGRPAKKACSIDISLSAYFKEVKRGVSLKLSVKTFKQIYCIERGKGKRRRKRNNYFSLP